MKKNYIIYTVISIICVIAIALGVYYEVFIKNDDIVYTPQNTVANNTMDEETDNPEQIREEFNSLFTNTINFQNNRVQNITKTDESKEIVYAAYNIKQEVEGKYNFNLNIPMVNITGEVPQEFNTITQQVFLNKANEIMENAKEYTIYNIDYIAYINENILSVAIKSSLKEGNGIQRVMVQTYNYNLETGEQVTLNDVLNIKEIKTAQVNKKIEEQVEKASKEAEALSQALGQIGQTIYKRDLNSAIYITDNVRNFLYGKNGKVYIIYAYGNSSATSEMDIIKID